MEKQNKNILIDFEPISRRIYYLDKSFYEILLKIKIPIQSLCGGSGTCGKCKILIQKGVEFLIPLTIEELKLYIIEKQDQTRRRKLAKKSDD